MQAPMTAIFLIAEITGGYTLLTPLIITSAISFATIRTFEPYSIYTKRIAKQGALLTHNSDQAVLTLLKTSELVETDFRTLPLNGTLRDVVAQVRLSKRNIFPVIDKDGILRGIILLDNIRHIMFDSEKYEITKISDIIQPVETIVYEDEPMDKVMEKFETSASWNLPVISKDGKFKGFVSKSKIFSSYREQLQKVSHE
jgi:CIC family chloride channel protein